MNKSQPFATPFYFAIVGVLSVLAYFSHSSAGAATNYYPYANNTTVNCRLYPNRCTSATLQTIERATYAQPATTTPIVIPPAIVQPVVVTNPNPIVNVTNNNVNNNTNNNNVYVNGGGSVSGYAYPVYINTPALNYSSYSNYPTYPSYPDYYETHYNQQPYYQSTNYAPLSVTCVVNTNAVPVGAQVLWQARSYGGSGYYAYSWSGTESLYGFSQNVQKSYSLVGMKGATVTVTSGGQTAQAYCPSVSVGGLPTYQSLPPQVPQAPLTDVACYATPSRAKVGQKVTWTLMANGSILPYRISWSGSEGLSGGQPSVSKVYKTTGTKKADITLTAADGKVSTRSCGVMTITSSVVSGQSQGVQNQPVVQTSNDSGMLSLNNVPWGWIVFLIIIVLVIIIIYLITNNKAK